MQMASSYTAPCIGYVLQCASQFGSCPAQARRLEVRLRASRAPGAPERKDFVHMLNCTLTATERTLCCVLENCQTPEGVRCAPATLGTSTATKHTCGMLSRQRRAQ